MCHSVSLWYSPSGFKCNTRALQKLNDSLEIKTARGKFTSGAWCTPWADSLRWCTSVPGSRRHRNTSCWPRTPAARWHHRHKIPDNCGSSQNVLGDADLKWLTINKLHIQRVTCSFHTFKPFTFLRYNLKKNVTFLQIVVLHEHISFRNGANFNLFLLLLSFVVVPFALLHRCVKRGCLQGFFFFVVVAQIIKMTYAAFSSRKYTLPRLWTVFFSATRLCAYLSVHYMFAKN